MIESRFIAAMIKNSTAVAAVETTLSWDEYDPIAVRFEFDTGDGFVTWLADFETMAHAAGQWGAKVGSGDVKFKASPAFLDMCIKSPDGHADIRLPRFTVLAFVEEVRAGMAEALECIDTAVDDFIREVLG